MKGTRPRLFNKPTFTPASAKPKLLTTNSRSLSQNEELSSGLKPKIANDAAKDDFSPQVLDREVPNSNQVSASNIVLRRAEDEVPTNFEEARDIILEEPSADNDNDGPKGVHYLPGTTTTASRKTNTVHPVSL